MGDRTSHRGTVVSGDMTFTIDGQPVARIGDKVFCPRCSKTTVIVTSRFPTVSAFGQNVAYDQDSTTCGALLNSRHNGHAGWEAEGSDVASGSSSAAGASAGVMASVGLTFISNKLAECLGGPASFVNYCRKSWLDRLHRGAGVPDYNRQIAELGKASFFELNQLAGEALERVGSRGSGADNISSVGIYDSVEQRWRFAALAHHLPQKKSLSILATAASA